MKNLQNLPIYFRVSHLLENSSHLVLGHDRPTKQFLPFFRNFCSPTPEGYPTILKQENIFSLTEELMKINTIKVDIHNSWAKFKQKII